MVKDFTQFSYERHEANFKDYTTGGIKEAHGHTWSDPDSIDMWRHRRMYSLIDPLLTCFPDARWVTIGDGRYGNDAHYIIEKERYALATDISAYMLKDAKDANYIRDYKKENAESLSFSDNEFDFALCKESFHHFPRPMIALYEMLRVSRKGVVLIEPSDPDDFHKHLPPVQPQVPPLRQQVKDRLKNAFFRNTNQDAHPSPAVANTIRKEEGVYEVVGNYMYTISKREIIKAALGLNLNTVVFKGINDHYLAGVEYEKVSEDSPLFNELRKNIEQKDELCRLGLAPYALTAAIILKENLNKECLEIMLKEGYEVVELSHNPYINSDSNLEKTIVAMKM